MELLVEFLSEEMPARMQIKAQSDLQELFIKALQNCCVEFNKVDTYSTPRRLIIHADIAPHSNDLVYLKKGVKINAPEKALEGFLRSINKEKKDLIEKDGYFYVEIVEEKKYINDLMPEILSFILKNMQLPTSMRWPEAKITWTRPIRNICIVFDAKPISIEIAELGIVTNNFTVGHRFMNPELIKVESFSQYKQDLENAHVLINRDDRKNKIINDIEKQISNLKLNILSDEELLDEVVNLVEYPFVGIGNIDKKYLQLPIEVLSTSMKKNQKYFTILDTENKIAPFFAFVANVPINKDVMIKGYEKVLKARLEDALFFFEQDTKVKLIDRLDNLKKIVFHNNLGTIFDKIQRLKKHKNLNHELLNICKNDLSSQMVSEFDNLQGTMGKIYALHEGIDSDIALAIETHYKPRGDYDDVAFDDLGWNLSLSDKLDSLVGFFISGIKPSGSKDPYGLRRLALGIIRLLVEKGQKDPQNISFKERVDFTYSTFNNTNHLDKIKIVNDIMNFVIDRIASYLKSKEQVPYDYVNAVLNNNDIDDIWVVFEKARALKNFLSFDDGRYLLSVYNRIYGIIKQNNEFDYSNCNKNFALDIEKKLFFEITQTKLDFIEKLDICDFEMAMFALSNIKEDVNTFFDTVKIDDDNIDNKKNRLFLIKELYDLMQIFADFSKIEK